MTQTRRLPSPNQVLSRLRNADGDLPVESIQILSGTTAQVAGLTEDVGVPVWDSELKRLHMGDGALNPLVAVGGIPSANAVLVRSTGTPDEGGLALRAAYDEAAALTPYGSALGPTNWAVVLVPPGHYKMPADSEWLIDADYVAIIGLGSPQDTVIEPVLDTNGTSDDTNNAVRQTASHVRIENLWFRWGGNATTGNSLAYWAFDGNDGGGTTFKNVWFRDAVSLQDGPAIFVVRLPTVSINCRCIECHLQFGGGIDRTNWSSETLGGHVERSGLYWHDSPRLRGEGVVYEACFPLWHDLPIVNGPFFNEPIVTFRNCDFENSSGFTFVTSGVKFALNRDGVITFSGCRFPTLALNGGAWGGIAGNNFIWNILDCDYEGDLANSAPTATAIITISGCRVSGTAFEDGFNGKIEDSVIRATGTDRPGIVLAEGAQMLNCIAVGNGTGEGIGALAAINAAVANCATDSISGNITNSIASPNNTIDSSLT